MTGEKPEILQSASEARKERVVLLLPHEVVLMQSQFDDLERQKNVVTQAIGEAMEQSSETWHDNAPGDVVKDEAGTMYWKYQQLKIIAQNFETLEYPSLDDPQIAIGSRATIQLDEGEPFVVDIAGAGLFGREAYDADTDITIATYQTPLATALIGLEAGTAKDVEIQPGRPQRITVLEVDQESQRALSEPL